MKSIKQLLGKSFKIISFILATILWSLFVYNIEGEWLYFAPLIAGDILFWETISWQFWKKKDKKKKKKGLTIYQEKARRDALRDMGDTIYDPDEGRMGGGFDILDDLFPRA